MLLDVVILAAGQGKRMHSALPKVLHPLGGKPMLAHVLNTARALANPRLIVVYGQGGEQVRRYFDEDGDIIWVEQTQLRGTGDAVKAALPVLREDAVILVLYADVPLIRESTLNSIIAPARLGKLALLTALVEDASGYGRILRNRERQVQRIVEDKDAAAKEKQIKEINTGLLAVPARALQRWLPQLKPNNKQNEYYLTDIVAMAVQDGIVVDGIAVADRDEVRGVNDRVQLAGTERCLQKRLAQELMLGGVTLIDPQRLDIRGQVEAGQDVLIDINVVFEGDVRLGNRVSIGPNCLIRDSVIGDDSIIHANCVIENAQLANAVEVGPFARLRPGAELADRAKIGNFVEVKNSRIGEGSKANHLAYLGDAVVGRDVNIGAGTITANYDGANKHQSIINDQVSIGSNSVLVAPVTVGKRATVGAGSVLSRNVPEDVLVLTRAPVKQVPGWKRPAKQNKT